METQQMIRSLVAGKLTKKHIGVLLKPLVIGFQETPIKVVWRDPQDNRPQAGNKSDFLNLEAEKGYNVLLVEIMGGTISIVAPKSMMTFVNH